MMDKGLGIFLMLLFGMGGITILILAWVQSMPVSQRILTTFVGSTGVLGGGLIWLLLSRPKADIDAGNVLAKVETRNESN